MRLRAWILLALVAAAILMALNYLFWIGTIPYEYVYSTTMLLIALAILISIIDSIYKLWQRHKKRG